MTLRFSPLSLLVLTALIAAATFGLTRKYFPVLKIQTQERVVEQTKVVTRIVHTKAPSGAERTETVIVDTGSRQTDASTTQAPRPRYTAGLQVQTTFEGLKPDYALDGSMRLLGPFHVTASLSTSKQVGVGLRMEF